MSDSALQAACKPLNTMMKIILILAIMIMSVTGALMLRLKKGPLDLEFAKERIEAELSDNVVQVEIGKAQLLWPEIAGPLLIGLDKVKIIDNQKPVLVVNQAAVGLSGLHLIKGKIRPDRIIIQRPEIKLFDNDGNLNAFWRNIEKKKESQKPKRLSQNVPTREEFAEIQKQLKLALEEKSRPTPRVRSKDVLKEISKTLEKITDSTDSDYQILSTLDRIQIKDAVLYGADLKQGAIAALNITLNKNSMGLAGDLTIATPKYQTKNGFIRSDLTYRKEQKDLTFQGQIENFHTSHLKPFIKDSTMLTRQDIFLNGNLQAALDDDLEISFAKVDLDIPQGKLDFDGVYKEPLLVQNLKLKAQLNRPEKKLIIDDLSATVGGVPVQIKSNAVLDRGLINAPISLTVAQASMTQIANLVPPKKVDTKIGKWLTKRLKDGVLKNVNITTNLEVKRNRQTKKRDIKLANTKMKFNGEGMTVKYHDTLMPVKNASASGVFEDGTLSITSKKGQIGDVQAKNVSVKIMNLTQPGKGLVDIDVSANGPLKTGLKFAADKPIKATKNLNFDVNKVKGNADFNLKLSFPAIKKIPKEKVKVVLDGTITNLTLPNIVRGQSLTGGPYTLKFGKGEVSLKGKGKFSGRDADVSWMKYLNAAGKEHHSKVTVKMNADTELCDAFGLDLKSYLSGSFPVDITYTDRGEKAQVDVKGDLTPANLNVKSVDYLKPSGEKSAVSLSVLLNNDVVQSVKNLKIDSKNLKISNGNLQLQRLRDGTMDIKNGTFDNITLRDHSLHVSFKNASENVIKVKVSGDAIDIRPFIKSDNNANPKKDREKILHLTLNARKMQADNKITVRDAKLYLELDKKSEPTHIELDAKVGKGDLKVRFVPDGTGKRDFTLFSGDAGATLMAFGLYDKMRDGTINIKSKAKEGKNMHDLQGRAIIENFSIRQAPVLAKLLGALSLPGVQNLLGNDGVVFRKLASDFEWRFRDNGNILVIEDGRTSGNELGLTFEGVSNLGDKTLDISGTIIPLSSVNKVIGQIPVIGNILSGEALLSASYSMKGTTKDPKIIVNPLSVLAPGFLKKILFEDDLKKKIKKEEKKK